MLAHRHTRHIRPMCQRGTTVIEVLITMVILAFGLLGLAGFQSKLHLSLLESYQRAQAIVLVNDLAERISANREQATSYLTSTPLGKDDSSLDDCSALANGAVRDKCEWSNALKGAAEKKGTTNIGAMTDARGCVTQLSAEVVSTCTPAVYQVTVAWQGLHKTKAPDNTCATGLYGDETYRRAISARVSVGLPTCSP